MLSRLSIVGAARAFGPRTALVWEGREYSFGDLASHAERAAGWLARAGCERNGRVGLVASSRLETIAALLACWEMGICPVLIHPKLTGAEREALRETVLLSAWIDEDTSLLDQDARALPGHDEMEGPAAILFTSGTSGRPKAAVLSHRAFIASARGSEANLGWQEGDRWLLSMPLAHVGGLSIVTRTLLGGRTAVLSPFRGNAAHQLLEIIEREHITLGALVPTMLRRILESEPNYRFPPRVRAVLMGGAATPATLLAEGRARSMPLLTTYGLTEACSQVTTQRYGTPPDLAEGSGAPLAGVEVRIEDGEVQVRGPTLMDGYLLPRSNDLERPFLPGGWYRTKDLGTFDEQGRLHLRGRASDMLISGGENVYPLEVEQILEDFPEITAACVFGVADDTWGELVACAVIPRTMPPSDEERAALYQRLGAFARARLANHKRPRRVALVDAMILGSSGKVDRAAMARAVAASLAPLG